MILFSFFFKNSLLHAAALWSRHFARFSPPSFSEKKTLARGISDTGEVRCLHRGQKTPTPATACLPCCCLAKHTELPYRSRAVLFSLTLWEYSIHPQHSTCFKVLFLWHSFIIFGTINSCFVIQSLYNDNFIES